MVELPLDLERPPVPAYRRGSLRSEMGAALAQELFALASRECVTSRSLLLAAFAALLFRHSGQEEIALGTSLKEVGSGEPDQPVAVGAQLGGGLSALGLARDIEAKLEDAANEAPDFEFAPPFNTAFVFLKPTSFNYPGRLSELAGGVLADCLARCDLVFGASEHDGGLGLNIEFDEELFDPATIGRITDRFRVLLAGIVSDPAVCAGRLPLLTPGEQQQLLVEWNENAVRLPWRGPIHQLFEAQAKKTPDAAAVMFGGTTLSFHELDERSTGLAQELRSLGVGPDVFVGLCMERSADMIVGLLGILKAGCAFVPLDPEHPEERLAYMMSDTAMPVLVTQQQLVSKLPKHKATVICLAEAAATHPLTASSLPVTTQPSDLAYVIYTSGSTGRPKGVLITHDALANHCLECVKFYALTPEDRVLQFASLTFDAAIEQILPPLLAGACVVVRAADMWEPSVFQAKLAELGLTYVNLPPAYWHQLASEWARASEPVSTHRVRLVIVGGEAMPLESLQLWQQTPFNGVKLLNAYGPTETTITATTFEVPRRVMGPGTLQRIPIGRPRGARTVYILDRHMQPVPVGVPGELHIGGVTLARGYLNLADQTKEKFVADPFSPEADARLYKTGDLVCYRPDGEIEFLGRIDQQVKIRGFRIELEEIESVLRQHPGVRDSVVLAREDVPGGKRLVAYVVPAGDVGSVTAEQLRTFLAAKLPEYMVPVAFVQLEALPLSSGGKVNRRALPAPDVTSLEAGAAYVPPRTSVEQAVADTWCALLGLKQVGAHDDFFALGGHSLLATQVASRIRATFKVEMPLRRLFELRTVARLSAGIEEALRQSAKTTGPALVALPRRGRPTEGKQESRGPKS